LLRGPPYGDALGRRQSTWNLVRIGGPAVPTRIFCGHPSHRLELPCPMGSRGILLPLMGPGPAEHHVTARATPNKISWRRTAKESALLVRSNLPSQRPSSNDGGGTLLGSSIHSSFDFFVYSLQSATRSRFNFLSIPYRWRGRRQVETTTTTRHRACLHYCSLPLWRCLFGIGIRKRNSCRTSANPASACPLLYIHE
jgi:hypothetical protein